MVPKAILGLVGVTDRDTSMAGVTVSVVDPEKPPNAAMIVVAPVATEVANPVVPAELLMVAAAGDDELHVTAAVRS